MLWVKEFAFAISEDDQNILISDVRFKSPQGRLGTTIRGCQANCEVFLFVRVRVERDLSFVFHGVCSFRNTKRGFGEGEVLKHFFIDLCSHLCESFCVSRAPQLHNIVPR